MLIRRLLDWGDVSKALDHIRECRSYYFGGTLCIDMEEGYTVCLNRNGKGFAFVVGDRDGEYTFTSPEVIARKTNEVYQEVKGK